MISDPLAVTYTFTAFLFDFIRVLNHDYTIFTSCTHALQGMTQILCYVSFGCAGETFNATTARDCCVGNGLSYDDGSCSDCTGEWRMVCTVPCPHAFHAVWGFQNSNGDTIIEVLVSELGLSVSIEVFFTVVKGVRLGTRNADITSTPITASR